MIRQVFFLPFFLAAANADLLVHPEPQQIKVAGGDLRISASTRIVGGEKIDEASLALLRKRIGLAKAAEGNVSEIVIVRRGDSRLQDLLKEVPGKSGAYRLLAREGKLVIAGHDERGIYYALRTLEQLLDADADPSKLPAVEVTDWPVVSYRGVVEGFYGTPWSHEKRLNLIRFMGRHKLNTYIYGPKDDPYHSSPHWRDPYPEQEAARIKELADACREAQVDFVWAVHPGKDIKWTDEDFGNVLKKFEAMHRLGVRSFSVFFDDISGEGTKADQQARLLNFLHEEFVVKKGDVTPLVMCPTQYNKAWSGGDYLDVLGEQLHPSIHVMWTGNSVIADLDRPSMEWINGRIKRNAYIWWNFPVSDYVRNHLLMGPAYGNQTDIGELYSGFVSNPMERSEASKIALHGVAGYTWNPRAYDPDADWKAAIREVMPGAPEAFETFCAHNSDLGPNGHGYRRKESVAFAPVAETFLKSLREERRADPSAVRAEMVKIAAAPAAIRKGSANPLLMDEIGPWLDAFEKLGAAGTAAVDALVALESGDLQESWSRLSAAHTALDELAEIDRTQNRNPHQPGIRTATLVVNPLVRETVETVGSRLISKLSGRAVFKLSGINSSGGGDGMLRMLDGKDDTFHYVQEIQKKDDWYGVDLGGMHEVRRIRILQGRNDKDHDMVHRGVLEGDDGKGWRKIASAGGVRIDVTLDKPAVFRRVRLRVEEPGVPGGKPDVWTAIRQFEVNPRDAAILRTDLPAFAAQPVRYSEGVFSVSPAFEVHPFPPGKFIGLLFPGEIPVSKVELDLKTPKPAASFVLEGSADGKSWSKIESKEEGGKLVSGEAGSLRAIRVRNQGRETQQVTLAAFAVSSPEKADSLAVLADGSLLTTASIGAETEIKVTDAASKEAILFLGEKQGGLRVIAKTSAGRKPLPLSKGSLQKIALPAGTTSILLSSIDPATPVVVRELAFSSR